MGTGVAATAATPPPPPNPNIEVEKAAFDSIAAEKSDEPIRCRTEQWDITSISALAALRMLIQALESLAEMTGDIPPTPPISRPSTPQRRKSSQILLEHNDSILRRATIAEGSTPYPPITIGSPEAHPHEAISEVGSNAQEHYIQHAAIARRFFSKVAPPFTLSEYLLRFHRFCPHSPGVYLAAAGYCHRLCVSDLMVPATNRTIHRLSLAAIRIAAKALEDNKWAQERVAKVGGISRTQLMNLEVTLCYLLDFELWVDDKALARRMFLLQQAARHGIGSRGPLGGNFGLKLPMRQRTSLVAG